MDETTWKEFGSYKAGSPAETVRVKHVTLSEGTSDSLLVGLHLFPGGKWYVSCSKLGFWSVEVREATTWEGAQREALVMVHRRLAELVPLFTQWRDTIAAHLAATKEPP